VAATGRNQGEEENQDKTGSLPERQGKKSLLHKFSLCAKAVTLLHFSILKMFPAFSSVNIDQLQVENFLTSYFPFRYC
jgi:hypothetical protein